MIIKNSDEDKIEDLYWGALYDLKKIGVFGLDVSYIEIDEEACKVHPDIAMETLRKNKDYLHYSSTRWWKSHCFALGGGVAEHDISKLSGSIVQQWLITHWFKKNEIILGKERLPIPLSLLGFFERMRPIGREGLRFWINPRDSKSGGIYVLNTLTKDDKTPFLIEAIPGIDIFLRKYLSNGDCRTFTNLNRRACSNDSSLSWDSSEDHVANEWLRKERGEDYGRLVERLRYDMSQSGSLSIGARIKYEGYGGFQKPLRNAIKKLEKIKGDYRRIYGRQRDLLNKII
jgi:hypothetical protein